MQTLLIVGAGGHGKVVAEVAADCGYDKIEFLDDHNPHAIGRIDELERFIHKHEYAFVGIGNNILRAKLTDKLKHVGYKIPVLIHPTAYVSKSAFIGEGTIVEPKAIVNTATMIQKGCIISIGSIIDHNVVVEEYSHVNAGAIIKAGATVNSFIKLEAGQVVLGYDAIQIRN